MTHKLITKEQYEFAYVINDFNSLPDIDIPAIRECLEFMLDLAIEAGDNLPYFTNKADHLLATLPKKGQENE